MSYKNNETNIGKKWSDEEITDLKKELTDSIPFSEIALSHKRSERAIELQGLNLANKILTTELKDKGSSDEKIYGFDLHQIKEFVDFKEKQKENHEKKLKEKKEKEEQEELNGFKSMSLMDFLNEKDESFMNIELNKEQQDVFDKITTTNENVFLTGSPGTGKSYTLKKIIGHFKYISKNVGITSTTGCSAILIGARTLHSYLKLGISDKTAEQLVYNLKKHSEVMDKLANLETLIIEEVSMLSDKLFTTISKYLSLIRKNPKPFGGIQLLLVGDFCQLPPINDNFCFLSDEWTRLNLSIMNLQTLVRQDGDIKFQKILERARTETITDEDISILKECKKRDGIEYTCLCATNKEADKINNEELNKLKEKESLIFKYVNSMKKTDKLEVCEGCKVMVNWNIDISAHIINGTTGTIISLDNECVIIKITNTNRLYKIKHMSIKDENTGLILATIMPLQLAWGITIHKSQGATLDYLLTDLGLSIFAFGQAYVALSRVKTLKNLALIDIRKDSFKINPSVKEFYK